MKNKEQKKPDSLFLMNPAFLSLCDGKIRTKRSTFSSHKKRVLQVSLQYSLVF